MIMYEHGGSQNHGCEAIVRSTLNMFTQKNVLFSMDKEQDIQYGLDKECFIINDERRNILRGTWEWFVASLQIKLLKKNDWEIGFQRKNLISFAKKNDIFLSIGGDNYCYPGVENLASLNRNLKKKGTKLVLWGCSVEPNVLRNVECAKDISKFDLISARESISYEALKKVNSNTILAPDPAFTLPRIDLPLPENWIEGKMIGINVSPLIMRREKKDSIVFKAYVQLIKYILDETDWGIALIPHVVWEDNDDRIPLQKLYEEFNRNKRIVVIEDHNCMELKGYIARCKMFIGARTHATIAAYSNNVPTLVLGYSVKAKGIAKDIFGDYTNYVLSVEELQDSGALLKRAKWLFEREESIREHLRLTMPEYIEKAYKAKDALKSLAMQK